MMIRLGPTGQTAQVRRIKSGLMMLRNKLSGLQAQAEFVFRMGKPNGKGLVSNHLWNTKA